MLTSIRGLFAASLIAGSVLTAVPAFADETDPPSEITVTGNVAMVSDYRFRGLSLSGGDFAVQGGINVNHSSGFYAGAWASSLEDSPAYGNSELDLFVGWTGAVASGLTLDAGLLRYTYLNSAFGGDFDYYEPYASLTTAIGPATAKVGVAYAPVQKALDRADFDGDGKGEDNLYVYTDLGFGIPNTPISLSGHLGYTDGVQSPKLLTGVSTDGGFDYSVGASANLTKNLSVGVSYVGVDGASTNRFSDDTVVATVKASF